MVHLSLLIYIRIPTAAAICKPVSANERPNSCMESCRKVYVVVMISVIMCIQMIHCDAEQQYKNFNKLTTCQLNQRLGNGSVHPKSGEYSSLIKCAAECQNDCCGVNLDEHRICYHHVNCTRRIHCTSKDVFFEMYLKNPCEHNGRWDVVLFTCKCIDGWVGDRCERYPRTCKEMTVYGYEDSTHKRITLHPETSPTPFLAYCSYYSDRRGFFTYVLFNTGEYDNTMTWSDYVNGFHHNSTNYWLGLDKMKLLNDAGHTVILLRVTVNISGTTMLPYYSFKKFHIGPAETGYNFTAVSSQYNSEGGVYGDCLTPVLGVAFSTADHDNDLDPANCASEGKAGWWFKTCNVGCNPLGPASSWRMTRFNSDRSIVNTYMYFEDV